MGNAWEGDWKARIDDSVRKNGQENIWDFLVTHPAIPLREIADMIGDAAPIQVERLATAHCAEHQLLPELVRDMVARSIVEHLPQGWGSGNDFKHALAVGGGTGLPSPYSKLRLGKYLLRVAPPPLGWLPKSGADEYLVAAYAYALAELPSEERTIVERGEIVKGRGSAYWSIVAPIWKSISTYNGPDVFLTQYASVRAEVGHLFASHWCQSDIRNGGFHQFFINPTGILAPEALNGFTAIGMPQCADVVRQAMQFFDSPYPREQHVRREILAVIPGQTRDEWDPFRDLNEPFYDSLRKENGGFSSAADEYARKIL